MTLSTQEYANLSLHAYQQPEWNSAKGRYETVTLDGITYEPLEHIANKQTGYQGTIYRRVDTNEIVVAHRGTEPLGQEPRDALTDAGMVLNRVNAQAADAEKLTQHALDRAREYKAKHPYDPIPEVTITGHSLGGALTQITASKSGLHGETFNAYGAVSLNLGIPEGGNSVINHVMAADPVSAASRHFGQVRVYATEKEIQTLSSLGYSNDPRTQKIIDMVSPPGTETSRAVGGAIANLGSHGSSNFATIDEQGRPHPSVLSGPQAQQRAQQYASMIEHYRGDVHAVRASLTAMGGTVSKGFEYYGQAVEADARANAELSSAMVHAVQQGYDSASKAVSEGIDAAQQKAGQAVTRAQKTFLDNALHLSGAANQALDRVGLGPPGSGTHTRQPSPQPTPTPARGAPLDPRHPQHPEHAFDQSMRQQLQSLNASQGITLTPRQLDNCTAALMADARAAGMRSVASMEFAHRKDGQPDLSRVVICQGDPKDLAAPLTSTRMDKAVDTPAEQSYQRFDQNTQTMALIQQEIRERSLAEQPSQGHGRHM